MPSPSADSKFVLSTLKSFKHTQFLKYTRNAFGILKSEILLQKLAHLSVLKIFWVYFKNWVCLKNLSVLTTNFELADGLGKVLSWMPPFLTNSFLVLISVWVYKMYFFELTSMEFKQIYQTFLNLITKNLLEIGASNSVADVIDTRAKIRCLMLWARYIYLQIWFIYI